MSRAARRTAARGRSAFDLIACAGVRVRLWQLALALLGGNLLLHQLPVLPAPLALLALMLLAFGISMRAGPSLVSLPACAAIGFCWTGFAAHSALASRWPAEADGRDVALSGWIDSLPDRQSGRTVFSLRVDAAATGQRLHRVRLSWYAPVPALAAGQRLELVARLRSPRGLANPGGFDYERWLFTDGYDATGYVREGRTAAADDPRPGASWLRFRAGLAAELERSIADRDAAALVTALALGERRGFGDRHWAVLQRTGTSHLVAVSGLHIGLIAALAYVVALRIALRLPGLVARHAHTLAAAFCLVPASVYAALAGFSLPTRRALLMVLVAQCLAMLRGRRPAATGLGFALILVLLLDPLASLSASFWLSFGAVGLLLAGSARVAAPGGRPSPGVPARVREYCRLQWVLTLGLAPLVIAYFGQVSLVSFFVNLVAIPLFSLLVVPLSLGAAALAMIGSGDNVVVAIAGEVARVAWHGLAIAAESPMAAFEVAPPETGTLWLALGAVVVMIVRPSVPGRWLVAFALLPLVTPRGSAPGPGEARVTVLDVGHGLAVAVETASHRALYDAGPLTRSGFDAGSEIVGPALAALAPGPLDLLVISHADSDHAGGADAVRARYPGARVLAGPDFEGGADDVCETGQAWVWDRVRFEVLHPRRGFFPEGNETSCVLRIETASGVLLLTGDIERRAEAALAAAAGPDLEADVVVVPHHGSATSSTPAFVARVAPRIAIVSSAHNNRWGFPRDEVRQRWESAGASLLVTADSGAIDLRFENGEVRFEAARSARRRYWQAQAAVVSGAIVASAL